MNAKASGLGLMLLFKKPSLKQLARLAALVFGVMLATASPQLSPPAHAASLVPNPSFETYSNIPTCQDPLNYASPWQEPAIGGYACPAATGDDRGASMYSVLVEQKRTRKVGIAVLRAGSPEIETLGNGTGIGRGGDDFRWIDTWSISYRRKIDRGPIEGPTPTGEALHVQGTISTWGVGTDGRVYRWNGSSWDEPNPSARLKQVSVGKYGGVWGVGQDGRVYKWNGSSWAEPNHAARLDQVSNLNGYEVWGIGSDYRIFRSFNGGASWHEPTPSAQLKQISAGHWNNIWGVTADGSILRFNPSTNSWDEPNPNASLYQIDAGAPDGAWGIGSASNLRIFHTYDGTAWNEPNPKAGLYQISAGASDLNAWGIGADNRVFETTNRGASWSEPNPAAQLKQVSSGIE